MSVSAVSLFLHSVEQIIPIEYSICFSSFLFGCVILLQLLEYVFLFALDQRALSYD